VTRQLLADERTKLEWSVPRVLMSKNKVKLLLNLCLIADTAIPRGGVISVSCSGEEDGLSFAIVAKGTNARVAAAIPALLAGTPEDDAIDARAIQAYYAGLIAEASGLEVEISAVPEQVTITARPASRTRDAAEAQVEIDA
jgi:histidine phosphotransferase ChpT